MAKKMTKQELSSYRDLLLQKRALLTGNDDRVADSVSDGSSGDEADQGAEAFETSFQFSLMQNQTTVLKDIDDALKRIDDGSYGVCLETGEMIPKARLKAIPWAKYTVEAQRMLEASGGEF